MKFGKSVTEILEMLCMAFDDKIVSWTTEFNGTRISRIFSNHSFDDDKRSDVQTKYKQMFENVEKIEKLLPNFFLILRLILAFLVMF